MVNMGGLRSALILRRKLMKQWKTVVVTAIMVSLVAILAVIVWNNRKTQAIRSRIAQYELIRQEQQLKTDIIKLGYEAALIQAKLNPKPKIQPVLPQVKEKE